ncbi:exoribonuclease II [Klebsiella pneumoniae]|nr:exoribonuclease II [Klebsiella pneumoniae]RRF75455.1 exoribonuclease II [Klebsiella pneumoniae]
MFQDNPLLAQLKQQLHSQTPRAEGVVKGTERALASSKWTLRRATSFRRRR